MTGPAASTPNPCASPAPAAAIAALACAPFHRFVRIAQRRSLPAARPVSISAKSCAAPERPQSCTRIQSLRNAASVISHDQQQQKAQSHSELFSSRARARSRTFTSRNCRWLAKVNFRRTPPSRIYAASTELRFGLAIALMIYGHS